MKYAFLGHLTIKNALIVKKNYYRHHIPDFYMLRALFSFRCVRHISLLQLLFNFKKYLHILYVLIILDNFH